MSAKPFRPTFLVGSRLFDKVMTFECSELEFADLCTYQTAGQMIDVILAHS